MKFADFLGFVSTSPRSLPALALAALAVAGFIACSDSKTGESDAVATEQSALSGGTDPVVRYWFNEASGTLASDSSGNGHSATLAGGATFVAGLRGNAARINGGTQRVELPPGVVQRCDDLTIAARVNLAANSANWARIFDFGANTNSYMFLTPRAGAANILRFGITTSGGAGEQQISHTFTFPTNSWKHVAVVLSGNTGTLYLDGVQVAQNTNLTLNPSALGATVNNWLGDSHLSADPTLNGSVDDFLVSCRPYTAAEVAWLASGTDPVAQYTFNETSGTTAADSSGAARNATLANSASFVTGLHGNSVQIAGGTQRVNLPAGIVQSCTDLTIAAHVRLATNSTDWARIFDIGANTTSYMFLTPRAGASNILRFAITTGGSAAEQRLSSTFTFPTNTWKHVAVTLSGNTGTMYVDGVQVAQNTSMTLNPNALGATANNWLGDSQFSADPTLNGTIDNFVISCRAFSQSEITSLAGACTSAANCNDGNACTADTCSNGFCSRSKLTDGTACANNTVCDGAETCQNGFCAAGTPPVVDDGNACTTDACDPASGVTHTPITGGACGGSGGGGAGGSSGSGTGATSGGGTSGSGGTAVTCPAGTTAVEMFIELPPGVSRDTIALGSYGTPLDIHDRVRVLTNATTFASVSSLTTIPTNPTRLGVEAHVQNFYAEPNVELRDRAHVHGNVLSPGTVTLASGAVIDGQTIQQPLTPRRRESWLVCHPNTHQGNIDVQPNQTFPSASTRLNPGAWGTLAVKAGARLRLRGNTTYYFESMAIESGAIIDLDTAAGGTQLYFKNGGFFRGTQARTDSRPNVLFGSENGNFTIGGSFQGTVLAPRGVVDLPTVSGGVHRGSFFGALVVAHQAMDIFHEPVDTTGMCPAEVCNGLCQCDGGGKCTTNGDCDSGLGCTPGAGPAYGGELGAGACQPPDCRDRIDRDPLLCGTFDDPCGICDVPPRPCTVANDCAIGETCSPGNGLFYGLRAMSVCWPSICATSARSEHCGSYNAPCGQCACAASCQGKSCGGDMSNGCGGQCRSICADRQPGCTADSHCASGSVCVVGGGPRVGQPIGTNVCLPRVCTDHDLSRVPCGGSDALCGVCPSCTRNCDGRCGGADGCGGVCTGSCEADEACTGEGVCVAPSHTSDAEIPDGLGGQRLVPPLDPGPTSNVGAMPGVFGVTDTGKATYRIPVAVPPGRMGLEPGLSLTYGGTLRNGALGVGWSLEGLSSIARCRHTENRDGYSAPIANDRSDRYCLDGVQILAGVEEEYGGDGAIHYPEFDPRTRVVSFGAGEFGPDRFEVRRSNGLIYTYGASAQASVFSGPGVKREWALERVGDRVGNYLSIAYAKFEIGIQPGSHPDDTFIATEMVPTIISYGGFSRAGFPPAKISRTIALTYQTRPDDNLAFLAGKATWRTRRLKKITTRIGAREVRSYRITYGDEVSLPASNGLSRIARIEECGGDGVCLAPTVFEYFDEPGAAFSPGQFTGVTLKGEKWGSGGTLPNTPSPLARMRRGAVDDVFYGFHYNLTHNNCTAGAFLCGLVGEVQTEPISFLSWAVISGSTLPLTQGDYGYAKKETQFVDQCDAPAWKAKLQNVGDIDLDGYDDLLDQDVYGQLRHRWFPAGSSPAQLESYPEFDTCHDGPPPPTVIADVTGDGQPDAVVCQARGIELYRNIGNARLTQPVSLPPSDRCVSAFLDVDGDGTVNLTSMKSMPIAESSSPFLMAPRKLVHTVLRYRSDTHEGAWEHSILPLNHCRETPSGTVCDPESPSASKWLDLNGDGLKDYVAIMSTFESATSEILDFERVDFTHTWINTGRGFVETNIGVEIKPKQLEKALISDVDRDGKEELLIPLVDEFVGDIANVPRNEWRVVGLHGTVAEPGRLVEVSRFDTGVPLGAVTLPNSTFTAIEPRHNAVLADKDGDGADDLMMISGPSGSQKAYILYGRKGRVNLLSSVTDGLGKRVEVRWDPGARSLPTYEPGWDCAGERCETRQVVVSEHSEWQIQRDGSPPRGERLFNYRYRDGRTNPADGKFLGFAERTIVERRGAGTSTGAVLRETLVQTDNTTSFAGRFPLAGRRTLVRVTEPRIASDISSALVSSARVTETAFEWDQDFGLGGLFANLESRTTTVSELVTAGPLDPAKIAVLTVEEIFNTDSFANVTRVERREATPTRTLAVSTVDTVYRPLSSGNLDAWLIALPEGRTVSDRISFTSPVRTEVRRTDITYYPGTNLPHHITREPTADQFYLDTEFVRFAADPYGNAEEIVSSTRGPEPARRSAITYSDGGFFPSTFTIGKGTAAEQTSFVMFDARFGTPTLESDPNGIATQRAYDAFGRVTREASPSTQSQTTYSVDLPRTTEVLPTQGVMAIVTETAGFGRTEVAVDAFGRSVRQVETGLLGEQVLTETLYDDAGRVAQRSRPHLPGNRSQGVFRYDYDAASRLQRVTQPDDTTIEFAYASRVVVDNVAPELGGFPDNYLWFTRSKDPKGNFSLSVSDQRGAMAASRDAGGAWVLVTPGPFGNTPVVTAANLARFYDYDRYSHVTRSMDPDRGEERYTYTPYGEPHEYFMGTSTVASLTQGYDDLGRLHTITSPEGVATYNYDDDGTGAPNQIGRLVSTTSADGSFRHFGYEPPTTTLNRGLVASITDVVEGAPMTTSFEYNDFGQLARTRYPGANTPFVVDRRYDAGGNLHLIGSQNFTESYWELLGTHQGYLPTSERYAGTNASDTTLVGHEYEALTGRVQRLTSSVFGGLLRDVVHTYDDNGNLETRTDRLTPSPEASVERFIYDERDRLTDHYLGVGLLEHVAYTPDGSGNIESLSSLGTYRYDALQYRPANMPSQAGNVLFGYDPRSNGYVGTRVDSSKSQNFTHDAYGMTTRVNINGDVDAVRYKYHTSGERSAKLLSSGQAVRYSGDYEREVTQTGATEHRYRIYSPFGPIGELVKNDSGADLSRTFWHKDILGSPELITNGSGQILHRQKFSAFGRSSNPTWESSNAAVRRVRRGYTGHEHDPETGFVNMNARLYDNVTGRFMTPDPVVQMPSWTQSWNRFSYAWNSPMNWVDPTGLQNEGFTSTTGPNGEIVFSGVDPVYGTPPDWNSPVQSEAPPTTSPLPVPDARTQPDAPGGRTGDEFGPPDVPTRDDDLLSDAMEIWWNTPTALTSPFVPVLPPLPVSPRDIAEANRDTVCGLLGCGAANAPTRDSERVPSLSEGRKTFNQVVTVLSSVPTPARVLSAAPQAFHILERIGGRPSARLVAEIAQTMRAGGRVAPITVFEHNGVKYVVDGHHRLAAAKAAGLAQVEYRAISAANLPQFGYRSVGELLSAASEVFGR
jgi:RHS repeat-associated protein